MFSIAFRYGWIQALKNVIRTWFLLAPLSSSRQALPIRPWTTQELYASIRIMTEKKNERKKQQKPSFSVAPTQVLELIATACIWVTCTLMNQSKQDQGMEGFHWPSHCHMPLKELGSGISLSQTSQTKGGDPQGRIIFIEHLPCARHCAQLWRAP